MTSTAILIPARYNSTRFPGKPFCDLGGMSMIQRVHETCALSGFPTYVLTDDQRVANAINDKCTVIIDKRDFNNGTERCAAAIETDFLSKYNSFVNVQGDMPDVNLDMIKKMADVARYGLATAWTDLPASLQSDPNCVKMVHNNFRAHWFGRGLTMGAHHLGVYGYTRNMLEKYGTLVDRYEKNEGLEQLRWLNMGYDIHVRYTEFFGMEINTPADMDSWNKRHEDLGDLV